jgi:O-antigen/teichoic acid export membrane protein
MFVMINVHAFIIGPLAGDATRGLAMVAIFSVCFRLFQLLQRVSNVSGMILLSHVVQEEKPKGFRMTMLVSRNIVFFSVVFCFLGLLTGRYIIRLISTSSYLTAYVPLILLLPGIVAVNAGSIINNMYWGHGYPYKIIVAPFVVTALGIVLDAVLIPSIGVSGASLSFTVMGLLWYGYIVLVFRNDSGFRLDEIVMPRYSDFAFVFSRIRNTLSGGAR